MSKKWNLNFKKAIISGIIGLVTIIAILLIIKFSSAYSDNKFYSKLYDYVCFNFIANKEASELIPQQEIDSGSIQEMLHDQTLYLNKYNQNDYNKIKNITDLMISEQEFLSEFENYNKKYANEIQKWSAFFELSQRCTTSEMNLYKDGLEMKDINTSILNSGDTSLLAYGPLIDRCYTHADLLESIAQNDENMLTMIETLFDDSGFWNFIENKDPNTKFDDYFEQKLKYQKSFDIQSLYNELNH